MYKNHAAGFSKRALLMAIAGIFSSTAMSFDIYQGPMVAERSMDPNVIYIHDDSGSMGGTQGLYMPDEAPSGGNNRVGAFLNKQYYSPDITYQPPVTYSNGKLVTWGNMDQRCGWPKVMTDGFTGTPGVCGTYTTLTSSTAVYYDYVPGFNSRIDNQYDYTWDPIIMINGVMHLDKTKAPETNPFNYEAYAFKPITNGVSKVRVNGSTSNSATVNVTDAMIRERACPILFNDVPESRAYYDDVVGPHGTGNPHATCRYSYRTGDVDFPSNYQAYTSASPYAGTVVPGNYHGRGWCYRVSNNTNFTGNAITRTCMMGRHVIGDTNGSGTLGTASNATVWNYTKYASSLAPNNASRKDHSLEHRVSKFVDDDGNLVIEDTPRERTAKEEIRNFANWYSYYRVRVLAARSGTSLAFANLVDKNDTSKPGNMMRGKTVRLGYDTINKMTATGPGQRSGVVTSVGRGPVPFLDFPAGDPKYPGKTFVKDFYDWVKVLPTNGGGTPLRRPLTYTGNYFANTTHKNPWLEYPPDTYNGTGSGQVFGCRRSFAILMTDGYYNGPSLAPTNYDVDGSNGPVIWKTDANNVSQTSDPRNKYQYTPKPPFFGQNPGYPVSSSLADVAMYYWNHDLQPGVPNLLAPTKKDPAFWQHMQTFTIGLGVMGRLSDTEVNYFLAEGTNKNILWTFPTGLDTEYEKIDDLMHAGLNGHGGTAAAEDAGTFVGKLAALLSEISGQDGSNTAPAPSAQNLNVDTMLYAASYSPSDWTGELLAYNTCLKGEVACGDVPAKTTDQAWSATEQLALTKPTDRNIFTRAGGSTMAFDTTSLTASAKSAIDVDLDHSAGLPMPENCIMARPNLGNPPTGDACLLHKDKPEQTTYNVDHLINYLRGDQTYEDTTTGETVNYNGFRRRSWTDSNGNKQVKLLGDIVNSSPVSVTAFDDGWSEKSALTGAQQQEYRDRIADFSDAEGRVRPAREQSVLVGAGDGMLHGFDALTGAERFAYIPEAVHGNLKKLADPQYALIDTLKHSFYVDGSTVVADIMLNNSWKTVAVGSTGRGGKSYFALNVENPSSFSAGDVLWEFTHSQLGYSVNGRAAPTLLPDGKWYAVFGNGYNSTNDEASLFMVELASGASYTVIDTGAGNSATPNGLATPMLVDQNGDGTADLAYAGDILGNLWKFDLVNKTATSILEARDPNGNPQPITAQPWIGPAPDGEWQIVVGTGKFFEQSDVESTDVQSIYSVRDCGAKPGCVSSTAQRDINLVNRGYEPSAPPMDTFTDGNGVSETWAAWKLADAGAKINYSAPGAQGYYIDLNAHDMEAWRIIDRAVTLRNNIMVNFMLPSNDPCASSVDGGGIELDPFNGAPTKSDLYKVTNGSNIFRSGGKGLAATINYTGKKVGESLGKQSTVDATSGGARSSCILHFDEKSGKWIAGTGCNNKQGRQSWRQIR
ncbi:MAG: hypothetical protein LBQ81_09880 [Zoogloeaceae bacterium]|jgi:type IV pilus assembly protein PilY1|nr:hypothetical protein [Zoogloeaceae bacterium]